MNTPITALPTPNKLLTTKEAAAFLKVSEAFLERDRCLKKPKIPFIRLSVRAIRYLLSDLEAYLIKNMIGGSNAFGH